MFPSVLLSFLAGKEVGSFALKRYSSLVSLSWYCGAET